jgi:hypothetical protein
MTTGSSPFILCSSSRSAWRFAGSARTRAIISAPEQNDLLLIITALSTSLVGIVSFFGSSLFFRFSSKEHFARVDEFFARLRTPVDAKVGAGERNEVLYRLLGLLCITYGAHDN